MPLVDQEFGENLLIDTVKLDEAVENSVTCDSSASCSTKPGFSAG